MPALRVGICDRLYTRAEDEAAWSELERQVPSPERPRLRGIDLDRLPAIAPWTWEAVAVHPSGLGLASATETGSDEDRSRRAHFFRTSDGGARWEEVHPRISLASRIWAWGGWPPEQVDQVAAQSGVLAFGWEDPWIFDGANSHLAVSRDGGDRWKLYTGVCPALARTDGAVVRVFCGGTSWTEADGVLRRRKIRLEGSEAFFPREVVFATPDRAYALVVRDAVAPETQVALIRSDDAGVSWVVENEWPASRARCGDINSRGALSVDVE